MSHVVSLAKGANVNLTKLAPAMKAVMIGLGWAARKTDGAKFDLDASLFMLTEQGQVENADGFIYYGKKVSNCGSVVHNGDNQVGEQAGVKADNETITVDLTKVPAHIKKLALAVSIDEAEARKQTFGMVDNAFIRVVNDENKEELTRFDLTEDAGTETAMVLGELYRSGDDWKFKAIGQGYTKGLAELITQYGLSAS